MSNLTSLSYKGDVTIKLSDTNARTTVLYTGHNRGTTTLSKAFAMFISGYTEAMNYTPQYIDLQVETTPGNWESNLKKELVLTAPSFYLDTSLAPSNWVAVSTAVLPFESMISEIRLEQNYRLCLMSGQLEDPLLIRELAYFESVNSKDLKKIAPGAQAIIEWRMQLLLDVAESEKEV